VGEAQTTRRCLPNRRRTIVGTDGCSRFFIMGKLEVDDPAALGTRLTALRERLVAHAYFQGVPSFDSARGNTAVMFHLIKTGKYRRAYAKASLIKSDSLIRVIGGQRKHVARRSIKSPPQNPPVASAHRGARLNAPRADTL